ncbi:MAG: hypothetical protein IJZ74_07950 [Clostridia bacterium]|nr:hypothetical protein [Clostridia bacterium]
MLNARINRVHRHTRPAAYLDQTRQARQQRSQRPGAHGFSFTGEFPEMMDAQPVVATERRRNYAAAGTDTGAYRAMGNMDAMRLPVFNRYGVQLRTALVMLFVFAAVLGGVWLGAVAEMSSVSKHISAQQLRIDELAVESAKTEKDIAAKSNDVSIRQEAVRLGLISSKGVGVIYLTAPETAVITPAAATTAQSLATIWGQQ